jgi:hypothetical protein
VWSEIQADDTPRDSFSLRPESEVVRVSETYISWWKYYRYFSSSVIESWLSMIRFLAFRSYQDICCRLWIQWCQEASWSGHQVLEWESVVWITVFTPDQMNEIGLSQQWGPLSRGGNTSWIQAARSLLAGHGQYLGTTLYYLAKSEPGGRLHSPTRLESPRLFCNIPLEASTNFDSCVCFPAPSPLWSWFHFDLDSTMNQLMANERHSGFPRW